VTWKARGIGRPHEGRRRVRGHALRATRPHAEIVNPIRHDRGTREGRVWVVELLRVHKRTAKGKSRRGLRRIKGSWRVAKGRRRLRHKGTLVTSRPKESGAGSIHEQSEIEGASQRQRRSYLGAMHPTVFHREQERQAREPKIRVLLKGLSARRDTDDDAETHFQWARTAGSDGLHGGLHLLDGLSTGAGRRARERTRMNAAASGGTRNDQPRQEVRGSSPRTTQHRAGRDWRTRTGS